MFKDEQLNALIREATDFFDGGSRFWSLGPSVRRSIVTAGRIRQNIKVQNARQEQALLGYEQTVLTSLEEVENGLVAFGKEQEHYQALVESETAAGRAVQLADQRYRGGLVDFLNVLEAERSLLAVQEQLARSEQTLGQNLVRLYKALVFAFTGLGHFIKTVQMTQMLPPWVPIRLSLLTTDIESLEGADRKISY